MLFLGSCPVMRLIGDLPPSSAHGIIRHSNRLTASLLRLAVERVAALRSPTAPCEPQLGVRTPSALGTPNCCATAPTCTPFSRLRSWPALQTNSRTSSRSSIRLATSRENFPHVRSASAAPARYAPARSSARCTTPRSADSSAPDRCHNESRLVFLAPPRSAPAPASLSGSLNENAMGFFTASTQGCGTRLRPPKDGAPAVVWEAEFCSCLID